MFNLIDINKIISVDNTPMALCIIVGTKGSTPRKAGTKMLVNKNRKIYGSIGGGALEKRVVEDALSIIYKNKPELFRHDLLHQHSMCCGGTIDIYIEPVKKKNKLYIFGAGHTGQALAKYALDMDFEVVVIDDRKEYIDNITLKDINKMNLDFVEALRILPFDEQTFITVMTYNHQIDRMILANCIKKQHAYLGIIGSQRKLEITKKIFVEGGISTIEELNMIAMPIGIDIKAETPNEIAISILAEIVKTKYSTLNEK